MLTRSHGRNQKVGKDQEPTESLQDHSPCSLSLGEESEKHKGQRERGDRESSGYSPPSLQLRGTLAEVLPTLNCKMRGVDQRHSPSDKRWPDVIAWEEP